MRRLLFMAGAAPALAALGGACGTSSTATDAGSEAAAQDAGVVMPDAQEAGYQPTPAEEQAFAQLETATTSLLTQSGSPGASIAIVLHGQLAFAAGVGVKSIATKEPVTVSTRFGAGSMSKVVTAATALHLQEQGKLDITQPVSTYLPWLPLSSGPAPSSFTPRSLLTMTSGYAADTVGFCGNGSLPTTGSRQMFFRHNPLPLWFPPGAAYVYSNTGYSLLATIIEAAAGVADGQFEPLATDDIMVPAGMATATFDMQAVQGGDYAVGYALNSARQVVASFQPTDAQFDCPMLNPAGGLFATATDFARLAQVLLAKGGGVLSSTSVTTMETPAVDERWFPGVWFALGLEQWNWPKVPGGHLIVRKDGDLPGFISVMQLVPDLGFAVVVLVNAGGGTVPVADDISYAALQYFLSADLTVPPLTTSPSTWGSYPGTYDDSWGWLGPGLQVTLDGGALFVSAPNAVAPLTPFQGPMVQLFPDTWQMPGGWEVSFFGGDGGPSTYFATRAGVGIQ